MVLRPYEYSLPVHQRQIPRHRLVVPGDWRPHFGNNNAENNNRNGLHNHNSHKNDEMMSVVDKVNG